MRNDQSLSAARPGAFPRTGRLPNKGNLSKIGYDSSIGVDDFVQQVHEASPMELVMVERMGVNGQLLHGLSKSLAVPASRIFTILGVPKATAIRKSANGEMISGSSGQAAIAMAKLLGLAQDIVAHSTAAEAKDFDSAAWLGRWLETPQPALGGRKPADLMDTPTGVEIVTRLLGSLESGSFQ